MLGRAQNGHETSTCSPNYDGVVDYFNRLGYDVMELPVESSAEHLVAAKALCCTAMAWNLIVAESFAKF